MITLAIQKAGRLSEKSMRLLRECDIHCENGGRTKLKIKAGNFPLEVLHMRDDDIPECIRDGIADIGIVGENVYLEKQPQLRCIERLGFAKCRLSIGVPRDMSYKSITDLENKSIATSYPNILRNYLDDNQVNAEIHEISGSVELAPSIGLADTVFDVVSSGSTLISNGLKEVETVVRSEAVLISPDDLSADKDELLNQLLFRIRAVNRARQRKYILLNAPNNAIDRICAILPGIKSPTVMPLSESGWSSVHSVIAEDQFWENIQSLKEAGAQGILVFPIEKMIL